MSEKMTVEKIAIMHAYERGGRIQLSINSCPEHWVDTSFPAWDWVHYDYRIKPEPKITINTGDNPPFKLTQQECLDLRSWLLDMTEEAESETRTKMLIACAMLREWYHDKFGYTQ